MVFVDKYGQHWNLIGFGFQKRYNWQSDGWDGSTVRHCPFHPGIRLIRKKDQQGVLQCVKCGSTYLENEVPNEEGIQVKHTNKQQTKIITAKKKKKQYDKQGNEINDEQLLKDIANGKHVIRYNEYKVEGDPTKVKRHIVRK
jgi:hypothetical protein